MFTKTEKGYLVLTLAFLAAGSGIKAYRHAAVRLGPFQETNDAGDIRDTRVIQQSPEVPGVASVPEASTPGHDTGGRDTVSDSSIPTATPFMSSAISSATPNEETGRAPGKASDNAPSRAPRTKSKAATAVKVDLNRAEAPELTRVPGIGAKTAQAIVEYRRTHGPYRDFRDLLRIKGIGEKKLEKLRPNLIL